MIPFEGSELRPHQRLLTYYFLTSLLLGPFFFLFLIPLFFRYETLRYRFEREGVSMRWGILFRREISLNYSRIQDIHLSSNVLERWLGLGKVQVQTASGSAGAEMTIEGLENFQEIRDYLYSKMRGARGESGSGIASPTAAEEGDELTLALREIAAELRSLREEVAGRNGGEQG
jgi:membrane protein YdbS with pleckstrin-like domain